VGVPESHRRRGIATRVTHQVLRESRALGYKAAILKSSPLGEGVYRSLGFQQVSRLIIYKWAEEPPATGNS
jgi:predicted acetyltransferase